MAIAPSSNLLTGIANPAIADVAGARSRGRARGLATQDRRQQEEIKRLSGDILSKTFPGKLGELGRIAPDKAIGLANALGFSSDPLTKVKHFVGAIQGANTIAQTVGPVEATQFLLEARDQQAMLDRASGVEPETSPFDSILEGAQQDPDGLKEALSLMTDALIEQGAIADPGAAKTSKIRTEVRGNIRDQVKTIRKSVTNVEENFAKIQNLAKDVGAGNRVATAQAFIAMIKLGDDSTVRSDELNVGLNRQNPIAAIADIMRGNGSSDQLINSVTGLIDPLNPKTVPINQVLAVANSIASARIPSLQRSFGEAVELGETNLSKAGLRSVIGKSFTNRVNALSDLVTAAPASTDVIPQAQIDELKAARPDLTEEQIRAALTTSK